MPIVNNPLVPPLFRGNLKWIKRQNASEVVRLGGSAKEKRPRVSENVMSCFGKVAYE